MSSVDCAEPLLTVGRNGPWPKASGYTISGTGLVVALVDNPLLLPAAFLDQKAAHGGYHLVEAANIGVHVGTLADDLAKIYPELGPDIQGQPTTPAKP